MQETAKHREKKLDLNRPKKTRPKTSCIHGVKDLMFEVMLWF